MPRINLLPVKAARRRDSLRNELFGSIAVVVLMVLGFFLWGSGLDGDVEELTTQLDTVNNDLTRLTKEVKRVEDLKQNEQKVKDKIRVIRSLEGRRQGPARILEELSSIITYEARRVWLTALTLDGHNLRLEGHALDHEDISELQSALKRRAMFNGIRLEGVTTSAEGGVRVLNWKLTCLATKG